MIKASLNNIRPTPVLSTRYISAKTADLPGTWHNTSFEKTASKLSFAKGNGFATSHTSNRTLSPMPRSKANWFAVRMPSTLMSRPVTRQPVVSATCKAYTPDPQPISRPDEALVSASQFGAFVDSSVVTQLVWPKSPP